MPTRRDAATLLGTLALLRPAAAQVSRPLVVFAAASLQTALDAIAAHWKRETGKSISLAYAASSALARQIDQGAPADLFASADQDWMDWAAQRQLIQPGSRRTLLENTLVLVEPASLPPTSLSIAPGFPLAQMLGDGRLAIGQIPAVPAGRYAREALGNLQVWEAVAPKLAGAENVRAALAWVARGEARFGIVYATDARSEPRVRVVAPFPASSHAPILYPFAITAASRHPDAKTFLDALSSPAAIRIFEAEGFRMRP
jgi:molybdate transport system substrate-binding protein